MEEIYDIVDEQDQPLGVTKTKSQVHTDGDWHRATHVWIINPQQRILIQQRSATKESLPNYWDLSMGGHVSAGEQPVEAGVRELKEELGIDVLPEQLNFLFISQEHNVAKLPHWTENIIHYVYITQLDLPLSAYMLQESEVQAVKYVSVEEFQRLIQDRSNWMPHWEEYDRIIAYMKNL